MFKPFRTDRAAVWLARCAAAGAGLMLLILAMSATIRLAAAACGHGAAAETMIAAARGIHRVAASLLVVALLAMTWLALRTRRLAPGQRLSYAGLYLLTGFLAVVGKFSGANVVPIVTMGNIVAGMAMVTLFWRLYLDYATHRGPQVASARGSIVALARGLAAAQVWLGSWLAAIAPSAPCGAGTGRNAWVVWPDRAAWQALHPLRAAGAGAEAVGNALSWLRLLHELSAVAVVVLVASVGVRLARRDAAAGGPLLALIGIQVVLALGQLALDGAWMLGVLHNVAAAMLLAALAGISVQPLCRGHGG